MAIKVFNYTDDKYIEAADTRAELAAIIGNNGVGFKGTIERNGTTDTYTVKAGSHAFIGGLSVRFLTDESFDLTTDRYIAVETTYTAPDTYACTVATTSTIDSAMVGSLPKQVIIYDKQAGNVNHVFGLNELNNTAQMKKITDDTGGVKIELTSTADDILAELVKAGKGYHTFYAVSGSKNLPSGISIRGFAHLTASNFGWAQAQDYLGRTYTNYYNEGAWLGWKQLITNKDTTPTLWSGSYFLNAEQTIIPTKKLSECRNGWVLVWSDFNPSPENSSNDWDFGFSYIPKNFGVLHNGRAAMFPVVYQQSMTSVGITAKRAFIYDDRLIGFDDNSVAATGTNDVCLRYVLEY